MWVHCEVEIRSTVSVQRGGHDQGFRGIEMLIDFLSIESRIHHQNPFLGLLSPSKLPSGDIWMREQRRAYCNGFFISHWISIQYLSKANCGFTSPSLIRLTTLRFKLKKRNRGVSIAYCRTPLCPAYVFPVRNKWTQGTHLRSLTCSRKRRTEAAMSQRTP